MPILNVPMVGQWGIGANARTNDCGVACVTMCLEYYGIRGDLTVDTLANETALSSNDAGLTCPQLVTLAARHGLQAFVHWNTVLDDLRAEIDGLRPVIALVNYGYISGRLDQHFTGWHFFVVVGYDGDHFVVNDPDYWSPYVERGHDILIPIRELESALVGYSGQCVFMEQTMSDQVIELEPGQQLVIRAKSTPPADLPGVLMYATTNLNVRPTPGTTGAPVATLLKGDAVRVVDASVSGWKEIVAGAYTGRFVSAAYLSADPN